MNGETIKYMKPLPCPHCGAELVWVDAEYAPWSSWRHPMKEGVDCPHEGTEFGYGEESYLEMWNRRVW